MNKGIVLVIGAILVILARPARADEISDLKQQLSEMQQRLAALEAKQAAAEQDMDQKITEAVDARKSESLPSNLKWAENVKLSGDMRYRHEYNSGENDGADDRNRNRIRARLNIDARVNDEVDLGFTLASGSSDSPVSANQTLGDSSSNGFGSKSIWLDRAFADWHPNWAPNTNMLFGKTSIPFFRAGGNQLVFDDDLRPEGVTVKHKFTLNENSSINLNGGGYWVAENSGSDDIIMWAAQAYLTTKLTSTESLIFGGSYYSFDGIKGQSAVSGGGNNLIANGNTISSSNKYANNYELMEAFGEYSFLLDETPASLYGSYVNNGAVGSGSDTAWAIGAKYNKAKDVGTWELGYEYREVESDAVVGALNDSDFANGFVNSKGHKIGFKYQVAKNMQAGLSLLFAEDDANASTDRANTIQADLVWKF